MTGNDCVAWYKGTQFSSLFFFLVVPYSMWDLSSSTRLKLASPALRARNLNHWTSKEVPLVV